MPTSTDHERPAPFDHIVVATDFSPGGGRAILRAGWLPLAPRGKVTVLHILPDRLPKMAHAEATKLARQNLAHATELVSEAAAALGRPDVRVSSELCEGQPYVEIIRHARKVGADLLLIGRHGRRPLRDMFIGSTAEHVIRAGDLPVLVVSRKASHAYERPLIGVDLEDTCRAVVTVGLRALGPEVTSCTLVHAYHVPFEGFLTPAASPDEMTRIRKEYRQTSLSGLTSLKASLRELGVRWQTVLVRGDSRAAVLGVADRIRADLVVVGTHGRSGIAHALVGSVAEWIIQSAECDVLVARPTRVSFELP